VNESGKELMQLNNHSDDDVIECLIAARRWHTQQEIASHLGVDIRTIRRWESRESTPPHYIIPALKQLQPSGTTTEVQDPSFKFVDLFAGIGGIRIAFERIGGQCVFTSEWDSYAQKTYAENHRRDGHEIAGDITQIAAEEIPDHDVLLAGFPCQPFSIAGVSKKNALGRAHGFADETQGTLFFDVCRIIEAKKPKAFLLENVKNLVAHDKGRTFDVITRSLRNLGYDIHFRIIDGAHFVPQHRERILIVGFSEPVAFDFDALPLPPKGQRTIADILHRTDGSEPYLEWDDDRFFNHSQKAVNPKYTLTPKLWQYLQNYAEKHREKGNGFGFGLVYPHSIARTLSARYYKDGSEILVYQGDGVNPRRLTPRECARLMGFPDTFRIPVSDTRAYKQFGNSVVVDVMSHVAVLMRPFIEAEQLEPELPLRYGTA
jgi:DNA (cytosine-5)-methyltransferase 1